MNFVSKIMIDREMSNPKIKFFGIHQSRDFGSQEKGVRSVMIKKTDSDEKFEENAWSFYGNLP